jgi:hypothetical protein
VTKMMPYVIKILPILVYIDAFGWLVGVIPTLYYAFTRRSLPTLGRIRLMSGPFEKPGIDFLIATGIVYAVISGLKILAAYWLQNSRMDGAMLELILLGLSAIFWYGFELPLGPLLGVVQVILLALAWGSLS